ncbi:hypothetical protein [Peptoniphilus genitalis]|uniref:hypothetical protein n=1 Tax=Peptoniphilus genitalis TaxID=3036303 RepID=UPI0024AC841F|nr:hypothetical protein [Peptoniphilus sp. Marseille-Q7072]
MGYKNNLGKKLIIKNCSDFDSSHKLAYGKNKILSKKVEEIEDYIEENYIKKDTIDYENLIKDLISFKAFKRELEGKISDMREIFALLAVVAAILAVMMEPEQISDETSFSIMVLISGILLATFYYFLWRFMLREKNSKYNAIYSVSYAISILEAIKEDIYIHPEKVLETKEFNFEVSNADECIEPNIYSVKVKESLEDKS